MTDAEKFLVLLDHILLRMPYIELYVNYGESECNSTYITGNYIKLYVADSTGEKKGRKIFYSKRKDLSKILPGLLGIDIATYALAHEFGHHIDYMYGVRSANVAREKYTNLEPISLKERLLILCDEWSAWYNGRRLLRSLHLTNWVDLRYILFSIKCIWSYLR